MDPVIKGGDVKELKFRATVSLGLTVKLQHYLNICKFWNHINKVENVNLPNIVVKND